MTSRGEFQPEAADHIEQLQRRIEELELSPQHPTQQAQTSRTDSLKTKWSLSNKLYQKSLIL